MSLYVLNLFDLADPENEHLHSLREDGTRNYLWWNYDRLDDPRPLFGVGDGPGTPA